MIIFKGALLGIVFFITFLFVWFYRFMHSIGEPITTQFAVSPGLIKSLTLTNPWFWSALLICLGIGLAIVGYWARPAHA